jgi:hypothetical protein
VPDGIGSLALPEPARRLNPAGKLGFSSPLPSSQRPAQTCSGTPDRLQPAERLSGGSMARQIISCETDFELLNFIYFK